MALREGSELWSVGLGCFHIGAYHGKYTGKKIVPAPMDIGNMQKRRGTSDTRTRRQEDFCNKECFKYQKVGCRLWKHEGG